MFNLDGSYRTGERKSDKLELSETRTRNIFVSDLTEIQREVGFFCRAQ